MNAEREAREIARSCRHGIIGLTGKLTCETCIAAALRARDEEIGRLKESWRLAREGEENWQRKSYALRTERDQLAARLRKVEGALRDVLESFDADYPAPAFDLWAKRLATARAALTATKAALAPATTDDLIWEGSEWRRADGLPAKTEGG